MEIDCKPSFHLGKVFREEVLGEWRTVLGKVELLAVVPQIRKDNDQLDEEERTLIVIGI
jgi:hypothetical protein